MILRNVSSHTIVMVPVVEELAFFSYLRHPVRVEAKHSARIIESFLKVIAKGL